MRIIEVVEHRTEWAAQFAVESARLQSIFGERALAIHHIGSTAVVGLSAKPVIDILLVLDTTADIDWFSAPMERLGYAVRGECLDATIPGSIGRFYFSKDTDGHRSHQVHACADGHPEIRDLLVFRDYLRSHPDAAATYGRVKVECAALRPDGSVGYMRAKADTVRALLAAAKAWAVITPRFGDVTA